MKPLKPMWDDPGEAQSVRELLEAGRGASVSDYDFDKGLSDHLGHVAAGTPAPEWAKDILEGGAGSSGGAAGAAGSAGALAIAGWVGLPLVAAGVVTATLMWTGEQTVPVAPEAPRTLEMVREPVSPVDDVVPAVADVVAVPEVEVAAPAAATDHRSTAVKVRKRVATRRAAATNHEVDAIDAVVSRPAGGRGRSDVGTRRAAAATDVHRSLRSHRAEASGTDTQEAPPEDLHAKWARGVNSDNDSQADANDARLEREMRMLKVAQAALSSNATRALQLARRGEREFGASMFQAERQHVVILALVRLGRLSEARKLAKPYLARYPNGPFSARVRKALAVARKD